MADLDELLARLKYLVSLNEPKHGGPYAGHAAEECMKAMAEAAAAIASLREALKPFAAEKLPSLKPSIIDYDRHGLRRIMSPMEVATRNAAQALSPTQKPGNGE